MVDIHSHILWGVDDGSKSEEMTLNMLRQAVKCGTSKIVATPHFLRGHYEIAQGELKNNLKKIKELAEKNNINLSIYLGQEVYYTEKILDYYNEGLIGTINGSRYMLIEFPIRDFSTTEILDNLYELQIKGIVPVIAHPERYIKFIREPRLINRFIREGYLFQLNSGSIEGKFGKDVKKLAETFLENKIYSFIGSDAHRDEKRNTDISEGIKIIKKIDDSYLRALRNNGEKLLNNEEVEFFGEQIKPKKKGLFGIFRK
ncbi:tyrosine-protein phosphatase [Clostridium chauvoei]|uniref:protein-tyrosine-phosphatase n=2 Tax=Clostridium chauvoei TaxID=46867 RepID=S6FJK4_9CLOT|nr:CpsB/CapC family capsule biosynthesis tyrosine phosphatase [Clostridium chauvoei]ATD54250.1 capsular biosynthesis protein [Clostridium chauvoei]ATD58069.1 capsular biosynthesis protein [Clostridium chauvoei]MBX7279857.1 capsular biosynthesis protein [Clostridium chauvoei]MBX7282225.1 capsular biosynthesis protein [Clostridium chauvoei]MBX7284747.1 capsular biosynthesis protein [Clostridium chauvoei]